MERIAAIKSFLIEFRERGKGDTIVFPRQLGVTDGAYNELVGLNLWQFLNEPNLDYTIFVERPMFDAQSKLILYRLKKIKEEFESNPSAELEREYKMRQYDLQVTSEILELLADGSNCLKTGYFDVYKIPTDMCLQIVVNLPRGCIEGWESELNLYIDDFINGMGGHGLSQINTLDWHKSAFIDYCKRHKAFENHGNMVVRQEDFLKLGLNFNFLPALLAFEREGLIEIKSLSLMKNNADFWHYIAGEVKDPMYLLFARIAVKKPFIHWMNPFRLNSETGEFSVYGENKGQLVPGSGNFYFVTGLIAKYPDGIDPYKVPADEMRRLFNSYNCKLNSPKIACQWFSRMKGSIKLSYPQIAEHIEVKNGVRIV